MNDERKTKKELIAELKVLRGENAALRQTTRGDGAAALELQLAVERIRAEAMGMQKSDDLYPLTSTFLATVRNLGINTWFLSIAFIEDGEIVQYYITEVNWSSMGLQLKENIDTAVRVLNDEAIIRVLPDDHVPGETVDETTKETKIRAYQTQQVSYFKDGDTGNLEEKRRGLLEYWTGAESNILRVLETLGVDYKYYQIPFSHGVVSFGDPSDSEENIEIVRTLAESFSLGYLRFLDFQKLEQQTEQARRERAVERVRAEAMAMRKSDDLRNVAAVLYQELNELGFNTPAVSIVLIDKERDQRIDYTSLVSPDVYGLSWASSSPSIVAYDPKTIVSCRDYVLPMVGSFLRGNFSNIS